MNIPRYIPQNISNSNAPTAILPDGSVVIESIIPDYTFNAADLQGINDPITQNTIEADLSNYVSELGGSVVLGDITIGSNAGLIFDYSGEKQIRAFSETSYNNIIDNTTKTQYMTIDHGVTKLPSLNVTGTLLLGTNIPAIKIGNGDIDNNKLSTLNDINISTTLQNQLNSKQPVIDYSNRLNVSNIADGTVSNEKLQCLNDLVTTNTIETRLQGLVQNISENTLLINGNSTSINSALGLTNNTVGSMGITIGQLRTDVDNIDLSGIVTNANNITTLTNTKTNQLVTDALATKLTNISYNTNVTTVLNDFHTNNIVADSLVINNNMTLDGTFLISNNDYTITNQQFSYLKDIDTNVKTSLTNIISNVGKNASDIVSNNLVIADHENRIDIVEPIITQNTSNILLLQTTSLDHGSRITNIEPIVSKHTTDIASNTLAISNTALIVTGLGNNKQELFNSANRMNSSYIGDGSINNLSFQTLYGIDTNQSIQHQIDIVKANVSSLSGLEDLDIVAIGQITTNVDILNTFKTDQLNTNGSISSAITSLNNTKQNNITSLNSNLLADGTISNAKLQTLSDINTVHSIEYRLNELNTLASTTLPALINTKQNNITLLNRLDTNLIADGTISNAKLQTLSDINTTNSIEYRLNELNTLASTTLPAFINTKQNNININNLLESNFIKTGTDINNNPINLITKLDTQDTSISSLQSTLSTTNLLVGDHTTNISQKHPMIDVNNKLASTLISTNVNNTSSILSTILQSLTEINETQSSAINVTKDRVTDVENLASGHTTLIGTCNTNIISLQGADVLHDTSITEIRGSVSQAEANIITLQSYNTSNNGTITGINSSISEITSNVGQSQNDIISLGTTKQNVIDNTHKLSSSNVDYSTSALRFIDITSNLQAQLTTINGSLTTLSGLQSGDVANFDAVDANFTAVNQAIASKQEIISSSNLLDTTLIGTGEVSNIKLNYLKNVSSDIQAQITGLVTSGIPSISYNIGTTSTTITDKTILNTLQFGDASQQTTAFTNSINTDLVNTKAKVTDMSYGLGTTTIANTLIANDVQGTTINTINSSILALNNTKQNILSGVNLLNPQYLDAGIGTLSNIKLQYLSSIASDLATSLSSINSAITALQTFDSSQTTLNSTYAGDITAIYSGKQNILSDVTLLNPLYINAGTGTLSSTKMQYLSSIGGDIATTLSSKADVSLISNMNNTSDLLKPISNVTQTALNLKQNTIIDASLTIARTDGLQTALNNKQATLSNASNLAYVDILSSLTTTLASKADVSLISNINNTSDLLKPVSTAQQTALDLKSNSSLISNINNTSDLLKPISNATQTALNLKQDTIIDASLTIARTDGLQTALNNTKDLRRAFTIISALPVAEPLKTFTVSDLYKVHLIGPFTVSRSVYLPPNNTVQDGDWISFNWMASGGTVVLSIFQTGSTALPVVTTGGGSSTMTGGNIRTCAFCLARNQWYTI